MTNSESRTPTDIEIYGTFRDYIKHEDQLINYRMTWMLTIHGFLYATYGFTLQAILSITENGVTALAANICKPAFIESYTANTSLKSTIIESKAFLYCVCLIGMGISVSALMSINAAYKAIDAASKVFDKFKSSDDLEILPPGVPRLRVYPLSRQDGSVVRLPLLTGGGRLQGPKTGFLIARMIPLVLLASWFISILFLYSNSNIPFNKELGVIQCQISKTAQGR